MAYVLFAKMFGVFFIVVAIGVLFNQEHAKKAAGDLADSAVSRFVVGMLPALFGSWVVVQHNVWAMQWSLAVTLVGWFMLLVGIFRLWFVDAWGSLLKKNQDKAPILVGFFALVFGLLLSYVGFIVK
jgi:hypothetical protein